ncbi:hypothetical protein [Streptomyces spectabilis]|uniref:GNAT family N-acetyltransferase n=1 Tax=Streptomyces spectabilis TaxID=68270 RepID=A0A516RIS4_STRST|nr:hypothetical protein [Streptomyces spectabilis]QDQ15549.1 hypothetical protein FH965_37470 [Streptomyces spectabilis]
MDTVRLRRLNRRQAEDLGEDLADLFVETSVAAPGEEFRGRAEFLRRLADDVRLPGFDMLIAETEALAGCAYGFPVPRDGSWWQGFDGPLPQSIDQLTASGHLLAIAETLVHPDEQTRGLARHPLEHLLADHESSLGVTLVDPPHGAARAAFEAWGRREVGRVRRSLPGPPDGPAPNARAQRSA